MTVTGRVRDEFEKILMQWEERAAGEQDRGELAIKLAIAAEVFYSLPTGLVEIPATVASVGFAPGGKTVKLHVEVDQTRERVEALAQIDRTVLIRGVKVQEVEEAAASSGGNDGQMTFHEIVDVAPEPLETGMRYWDPTGSYQIGVRLAIAEPPIYKSGYDWDGKPFWMDIATLPDRGTFAEAQGDLDQYARDCNLEAVEEQVPKTLDAIDNMAPVDGADKVSRDDETDEGAEKQAEAGEGLGKRTASTTGEDGEEHPLESPFKGGPKGGGRGGRGGRGTGRRGRG